MLVIGGFNKEIYDWAVSNLESLKSQKDKLHLMHHVVKGFVYAGDSIISINGDIKPSVRSNRIYQGFIVK